MKTTLFLTTLASAFILAGCVKETAQNSKRPQTIAVSFEQGANTYAVDDPVVAGTQSDLQNVVIFLLNNNAVVDFHELTPAERNAKFYQFENVIGVNKVLVAANIPLANMAAVQALTTGTAIKAYPFSTASQASSSGNPGIKHVVLMGECPGTSFVTGGTNPKGDGHDYVAASVEVSALVARIEVGTIKAGTGLTSLTLNAVYVNNYFFDNAKVAADVVLNRQNDLIWTDGSYPGQYVTDGNAAVNATATSKCYAFQVFAGNIPHVVLKVSGEYSDGETFTNKWVTYKSFKVGAATLSEMVGNKVYRFPAELTVDGKDITDLPEPEPVDLGVTITVADWTVVDITPEV